MKNISMITVLIILAGTCFAAERVVLMEDFTNCGCSPCWNFEPTINSFFANYSEHLAVVRPHVSWPSSSDPIYVANPAEQNIRKNFYGVNAVPWLQFDGEIKATLSYSGLVSAYNARMAVPCHLEIQVDNYVANGSGTIEITLIAEEDLGDTDLKIHAIIVESEIPGTGYFASGTFDQAFREELFGTSGQAISFGPSYPDTMTVTVDYDTGSWEFTNLHLAVFVQNHNASGDEVMNAWYDYLGAVTGIEEQEGCSGGEGPTLALGQNPSYGRLSITAGRLDQGQGILEVYDITGRCVARIPVTEDIPYSLQLDGAGVYFARVSSGEGTAVARAVVVE
ncbi:MAG: T9SS type A sorting domain-containing protein [Candidatus Fermentibacteraceae bacterium]|nr:T9SS type A sorting domain-containing protein [Candidatus Fermentibacteraceae bacterium]MBN2609391.1 T9SS type A sorting domain-containing protein [Candidatus Fermentibacteraceae bacterium]